MCDFGGSDYGGSGAVGDQESLEGYAPGRSGAIGDNEYAVQQTETDADTTVDNYGDSGPALVMAVANGLAKQEDITPATSATKETTKTAAPSKSTESYEKEKALLRVNRRKTILANLSTGEATLLGQ